MEGLDQDNLNPTSEHRELTGYVVQGPTAHIHTEDLAPGCLPVVHIQLVFLIPGPSSILPSHILALSPHSGLRQLTHLPSPVYLDASRGIPYVSSNLAGREVPGCRWAVAY